MGLKNALTWFGLVLLLGVTWWALDLPPEAELIRTISNWLATYGLVVIFLGSILEAILFVGFYFPGSLIIFLGVGLAPNPLQALYAVIAVSLGMLCGYHINYIVGRYGWYRIFLKLGMKKGLENAQAKMQNNDIRYIFYTFWNPGLASFTSTAAGILHLPYVRFYY